MNKIILKYVLLAFSMIFVHVSCESTPDTRETKNTNTIEDTEKDLITKTEIIVKENIRFESVDIGDADPKLDKTVYYKIYINKELTAKTPAGLFFQKKNFKLNLSEGKYLFFAERWQLEKRKGHELAEYYRANNIWQMKEPVYLKVTPGGITKVHFGYDHDQRKFYINK